MQTPPLFPFDPVRYLANAGVGRKITRLPGNRVIFAQGDATDAVFYLQKGHAKLVVVSALGKEATITLLSASDFLGEEAVGGVAGSRTATARTVTACSLLRIDHLEMKRVLQKEQAFNELFLAFILARGLRTQADLIDQLFNSSEKRLARVLLLMAGYDTSDALSITIPKISQQALADLVGTTRGRINLFMNRFRDQGFVQYDDRIRVHQSLVNVVLHDDRSLHNAVEPSIFGSGFRKLVSLPSAGGPYCNCTD